jgi:hypothetical protein
MGGEREADADRLERLCCEEQRMLEGLGEGMDPMREGMLEAQIERACERLDDGGYGSATRRKRGR